MKKRFKIFLLKIDNRLFRGLVLRTINCYRTLIASSDLRSSHAYRITVYYNRSEASLLARLSEKYGSDKGAVLNRDKPFNWLPHSYTDYYERIFRHCRFEVKSVFECGIGTKNVDLPSSMGSTGRPGASLRMWRDFFPNAVIVGADIDQSILFQDTRIKTFYLDQTDQDSIQNFWEKIAILDFDLMIDDGLHTFEAGKTLFLNSVSRLSVNGIYVIEDIAPKDKVSYRLFFEKTDYEAEFVDLVRPNTNLGDNSLVVIRRRDPAEQRRYH